MFRNVGGRYFSEVGDAGSFDVDICLCSRVRGAEHWFERNGCPFHISVDNLEVMQILRAIGSVDQLHNISQLPVEIGEVTYKH